MEIGILAGILKIWGMKMYVNVRFIVFILLFLMAFHLNLQFNDAIKFSLKVDDFRF